jgi:hypothetical protein
MGILDSIWGSVPAWLQPVVIGIAVLTGGLGTLSLAIDVYKKLFPRKLEPGRFYDPQPPQPNSIKVEPTARPEKLRRYLIRRARLRAEVSYDEAATAVEMGVGKPFFREVLDVVSVREIADERPNITAIVHNPGIPPGVGFFRHHGNSGLGPAQARQFWEAEKRRVYSYWADLSMLTEHEWELIYDPTEYNRTAKTKGSKVMRFGSSGVILEGRNSNEDTWRVAQGILEFVGAEGRLMSRFDLQPDGQTFVQTNEQTAIMPVGQRLVRRG